jgi:hypothetical protein
MSLILKQDHTTWRGEFLSEIELLEAYLAGLKQHLLDEKERFHNEVEVVMLEEHPEYSRVVSFFRGLDDETWALNHIFSQHFPNLLLRSTLVTFYTFGEVALNTLCDRFGCNLKSKVSVGDLRGKGITRAKLYLTKICALDFGPLDVAWSELNMIAQVRNLITHADGCITKATKPQLLSYIQTSPYLRIDGDELILSPEYLDHFLAVIGNLIQRIGEQIEIQIG